MQPHDEEKTPLWDLLSEAGKIVPPKRFTDDVLRRIRMEVASETKPLEWFYASWRLLAGITVAVTILVSSIVFQEDYFASDLALNDNPEISELIASVPVNQISELSDLDTSINDNDLWLDTTSY